MPALYTACIVYPDVFAFGRAAVSIPRAGCLRPFVRVCLGACITFDITRRKENKSRRGLSAGSFVAV